MHSHFCCIVVTLPSGRSLRSLLPVLPIPRASRPLPLHPTCYTLRCSRPLTPLDKPASSRTFVPSSTSSSRSSDAPASHDRHSSCFRRRRLLGIHEHCGAVPDGICVVRRGRPLRPASSGCRHPPSFWLLRHLFSAKTSSRLFATRKTDATSSSMPSGCSAFSSPSFSRSETPTPRRRRSPLRQARFS